MKSVEGDLDNAPQNILSNITFEDAFKGKFFDAFNGHQLDDLWDFVKRDEAG